MLAPGLQRLISAHRSVPGVGTTFTFRVPVIPPAPLSGDSSRWLNPDWDFLQHIDPTEAPKPVIRPRLLVLESGENIWGPVSSEFATTHLEELREANEVVGRRWRVRTRARTVTRPNRAPKTTYKLLGLVERLD